MGWVAYIAIFIAYFVKGIAGFANTLIFSGIMNFFTTNISITPVELLLGVPSNIALIVENRKKISPRIVIPAAACMLAGIVPGVFVLKVGDDRWLKLLLGVVILALGAEMLLRLRKNKAGRANMAFMAIISTLSGVLIGIFGIGAFLVAYMERVTEDTESFKGNLVCVFMVDNVFRIILYTATGILNLDILLTVLKLAPMMALGFFIGSRLSKKIPDRTIRVIVITLLMLNGVSLIAANL